MKNMEGYKFGYNTNIVNYISLHCILFRKFSKQIMITVSGTRQSFLILLKLSCDVK